MKSRHFTLNSELTGAIAKKLPHAKNQPSAPGSFFNQFVTYIYIYIYIYIYNNRVLIVRMNYSKSHSLVQIICTKVVKRLLMLYTVERQLSELQLSEPPRSQPIRITDVLLYL